MVRPARPQGQSAVRPRLRHPAPAPPLRPTRL